MTTLVTTTFTGTDGAAWPAPWVTNGGTSVIASNRGQLTTGTGAFTSGEIGAAQTLPAGRVDVTVRFPAVPNVSARINIRWDKTSGNGYRLVMPTDYNGFQLIKVTAFSESALAEQFISAWAATTDYRVAIEFTGSLIRAKRWLAADSEPVAWDLVAVDSTYTTGDVAMVAVNNGSGGARSVLWDDITITNTPVGLSAARIGYHDTAFQAASDDRGLFTRFSPLDATNTRAYMIANAVTGVPVGGESAEVNSPDTLGPASLAELAALHFTYLNGAYHPTVLSSWTTNEKNEMARNLGYRLRLTTATLPTLADAGAPMPISLTFTNDGYARPLRTRPVQLVLVNGGTVVTRTLSLDIRTITPGSTIVASESVTAPTAGTWVMHLLLPDPDSGLAATPAYAIQLANTGVWDGTTGRNALGRSVVVS